MAKKVVQDVVPPQRSIRQIELPRQRTSAKKISPAHAEDTGVEKSSAFRPTTQTPSNTMDGVSRASGLQSTTLSNRLDHDSPPTAPTSPAPGRGPVARPRSRILWTVLTAVFGIMAMIFVAFHFWLTGAEVIIKPREAEPGLEKTFSASKQPVDESTLPYEVMTIHKTLSRLVPASGQAHAEVAASGMITIYNNFSDTSQRLIKNTRFESPDGLIYRIRESVEVPGRRVVAGRTVPGDLTVEIFADEPGDTYNIGPARFTIPGLKGEARFEAIYAESTKSIAGGFVGMRKSVEPQAQKSAEDAMIQQLTDELLQQARLEKPPGYVFFDGAVHTSASALPQETQENGVLLTEEVTLKAAIFNIDRLSAFIARNLLPDFDNNPIVVPNLDTMVFTLEPDTEIDGERIVFSLSGQPRIVWTFDEAALRKNLAGTSKSVEVFNAILSSYPGIESGRAYIRPFWQQSFPDNPARISIVRE